MEKLKVIEQDGKTIDFEVEAPSRFGGRFPNATGRIMKVNGEFQFVPRGNNFLGGVKLTVEELEAIIGKLRELNS